MDIISLLQFSLIIKLFFSVLVLFYFVFAAVVYRQIILMTQILNSGVSPLIKAVAVAQIIAVAGLFFLTLVLA